MSQVTLEAVTRPRVKRSETSPKRATKRSKGPRKAKRTTKRLRSPLLIPDTAPRVPSSRRAEHPSLFDHSDVDGPSWGWQTCHYCHSQGWTTPPEWLLAWTHPLYPDMRAVQEHLCAQAVPVDFESLPVRQRCNWCNGHGRRYVEPDQSDLP